MVRPFRTGAGTASALPGSASISCELRLEALGEQEARFNPARLRGAYRSGPDFKAASADGTAERWKQAGNIWRMEIDKLYQTLFIAAPEVGEEALMNLYKNAALDAAGR